eukprot:259713_1
MSTNDYENEYENDYENEFVNDDDLYLKNHQYGDELNVKINDNSKDFDGTNVSVKSENSREGGGNNKKIDYDKEMEGFNKEVEKYENNNNNNNVNGGKMSNEYGGSGAMNSKM